MGDAEDEEGHQDQDADQEMNDQHPETERALIHLLEGPFQPVYREQVGASAPEDREANENEVQQHAQPRPDGGLIDEAAPIAHRGRHAGPAQGSLGHGSFLAEGVCSCAHGWTVPVLGMCSIVHQEARRGG